jgi:hypothetical protein
MTCALTSQLYTTLQNQSQRFNEEFIRCRERNDPKFCFDSICKAMEIIDGIELFIEICYISFLLIFKSIRDCS